MVVDQEKQELRNKLLQKLLSLTKEEIKRRSKNVQEQLSSLPIYREAKRIMAYYPLGGEVDILEMIRKTYPDKRFFFPVMDFKANNLRAFEVKNLDQDFVQGPFGVMEPDPQKTKEIDTREIDMVIVPALGFDRKRNRLGRGAGFYDRFLAKITPPTLKVGIAFECQIVENLPVNLALDQKVDLVVTEKSII